MKRKVSFSIARVGAAASVFALASLLVVPAVAFAATSTKTTTLSSALGSTISLGSTSATVTLDVTPDADGQQTIQKDTVSVSTNNITGYNIKVENSDADTDMTTGTYDIATSAATTGTPAALTVNKWGWRVDGALGFGAGPTTAVASPGGAMSSVTFAGIPASGAGATVRTTATTASAETTDVWFSVAADSSQQAGTYTNGVSIICTTN